MIITESRLERMFHENGHADHCSCIGICHQCKFETRVEIRKTNGGYGLLGGVLCKQGPGNVGIICDHCYRKNGLLAFNTGPDMADQVARIANLSKALGYRLEDEHRLMTREEAYQQISLSASLLRAILAYTGDR